MFYLILLRDQFSLYCNRSNANSSLRIYIFLIQSDTSDLGGQKRENQSLRLMGWYAHAVFRMTISLARKLWIENGVPWRFYKAFTDDFANCKFLIRSVRWRQIVNFRTFHSQGCVSRKENAFKNSSTWIHLYLDSFSEKNRRHKSSLGRWTFRGQTTEIDLRLLMIFDIFSSQLNSG